MKKVFFGAMIGMGIGYLCRKMHEDGAFDNMGNDMNKFMSKAKKTVKDALDSGKNEAEYMKDRAQDAVEEGKDKLGKMAN